MKYCKRCCQPDTRPGIKFNEEGICPPCIYAQSLETVDWDERHKQLKAVVDFGKCNANSGYDCIIGVSGGKDSTRQALFVKESLGMKPLLVSCSYPPEQFTERGANNVSNMISLGFDHINVGPNPQVWKKLMRKGFLEFGNWAKSTELALFSSVPRLAIAYQIPLIWWGENAALQLGDLNVMGKSGDDGNKLKNMNTLGGGDITWLLDEEIRKKDIIQYSYPSDREMEDANLRIIFLGYYWKEWSRIANGNYSVLRGLEIRTEPPDILGETLGVDALDEEWVILNQMIKYLKLGFGKVTDIVNEEIRFGRMERETAINLVERYDGKCGEKYIETFCDYIDITKDQFWKTVERFVNTKLFEKESVGKYRPKFKVGVGL